MLWCSELCEFFDVISCRNVRCSCSRNAAPRNCTSRDERRPSPNCCATLCERWNDSDIRGFVDEETSNMVKCNNEFHNAIPIQMLQVYHPVEENSETLAFATEPVMTSLANIHAFHVSVLSPLRGVYQSYSQPVECYQLRRVLYEPTNRLPTTLLTNQRSLSAVAHIIQIMLYA